MTVLRNGRTNSNEPAYIEKAFGNTAFFRLTGGKQKLISNLMASLPESINRCRYVEPFLGGGSLFFSLAPKVARLNDANTLLVDMYRSIRDNPGAVYGELIKLAKVHQEDFYYAVRSDFNRAPNSHKKSAQLIYLNRACFNGVFRVNSKSEFNVPSGKKTQIVIPSFNSLEHTSKLLVNCELLNKDFDETLDDVGAGDFVYMDPPYMPLDSTAFYRHYTWPRFSKDDHDRLAHKAQALKGRGANVMISNADLPINREFFKNWYHTEISVSRYATAKKTNVRRVSELIITSYPTSAGIKGGKSYACNKK